MVTARVAVLCVVITILQQPFKTFEQNTNKQYDKLSRITRQEKANYRQEDVYVPRSGNQNPIQQSVYQINPVEEKKQISPSDINKNNGNSFEKNPNQNVYAINPPSDTNNNDNNGGNVYGSNPAVQYANRPNKNVYQVNPTQNAERNPDESHYGTQNVYGSNHNNAYGPAQNSHGQNENAYVTEPSVYGTNNANGSPDRVSEHNKGHSETSERPFVPNLLSRPTDNGENTPVDEKIPHVVIERDDDVYSKGFVGNVLEPKEEVDCDISETVANGEEFCRGQLIFQDDFQTLSPHKWKHDIRIPSKPDFEFLTYVQSKNNTYLEDNVLVIKPTLLSKIRKDIVTYGQLKLENCNIAADSGTCFKNATNYNILPPILSARMRTRHAFNFKYGRVEMIAKLPKGDWLYPELWLEPKDNSYGQWYMSGRVVLGFTRGNDIIAGPKKEPMGQQLLNSGCLFRKNNNPTQNYDKYLQKFYDKGWTNDFHNFTVVWTSKSMEFFVDQDSLGNCDGPNLKAQFQAPWRRGDTMAPFDKEFYLTVGVGAAGISEFPDQITTGKQGLPKPWRNVAAKALWNFYEDETLWSSSWGDESALKIKSIRVYAI